MRKSTYVSKEHIKLQADLVINYAKFCKLVTLPFWHKVAKAKINIYGYYTCIVDDKKIYVEN